MARNKIEEKVTSKQLGEISFRFFDFLNGERNFVLIILLLSIVCAVVSPYPEIAMWVGFGLAGYSTIANDSIQTIGTFLSSNMHRKWWVLWLYIGSIFIIAVLQSWIVYNGDVSSGRLATKGFEHAPTSFSFLQLAAPLILLVLTRLRMPVSTTFLILNSFSSSTEAILSVLLKSVSGYLVAFVTAIVVWVVIDKTVAKYVKGKAAPYWLPIQWVTSGLLWYSWIQQDAANIAIYLPRQLTAIEFLAFTAYIFCGLGILFYLKGDKIQQIVTEKSGITDIRAATVVDFVYAILLIYFKGISGIPMSTTWVFIGLLGGREVAISLTKKRQLRRERSLKKSFGMIKNDLFKALIGLFISLVLALLINKNIREEVWQYLME